MDASNDGSGRHVLLAGVDPGQQTIVESAIVGESLVNHRNGIYGLKVASCLAVMHPNRVTLNSCGTVSRIFLQLEIHFTLMIIQGSVAFV